MRLLHEEYRPDLIYFIADLDIGEDERDLTKALGNSRPKGWIRDYCISSSETGLIRTAYVKYRPQPDPLPAGVHSYDEDGDPIPW